MSITRRMLARTDESCCEFSREYLSVSSRAIDQYTKKLAESQHNRLFTRREYTERYGKDYEITGVSVQSVEGPKQMNNNRAYTYYSVLRYNLFARHHGSLETTRVSLVAFLMNGNLNGGFAERGMRLLT